jgi:outer membrane immunogenic protein
MLYIDRTEKGDRTMKKLLLGTAATIALAGVSPAFAADIPAPVYRPPPVVAPVAFSWTGCYGGGDVGYAWARARNDETFFDGALTNDANLNGAKAGAYLGCNYQTGAFVFGIEGDAEWAFLRGTTTFFNTLDSVESRLRAEASIRGRVGYAWDRVLFYATGGVAFARIDTDFFSPRFGDAAITTLRTGWTVGAGVEYAFTNNLIGRLEYRYADFGHFSDSPFVGGFVENHRVTENVVRVGLAWKWGGGRWW